jgi:thiaminase
MIAFNIDITNTNITMKVGSVRDMVISYRVPIIPLLATDSCMHGDNMDATEELRIFYHEVRRSLNDLEDSILNHNILRDAESGRLTMDHIKRFAINQWYIVNHDLRSLAVMLSRSRDLEELEYFKEAVDADYKALKSLADLLEELGIRVARPAEMSILPAAVAYTHYISWLAHYSSIGVIAFAFAVNFPVWGQVSTKFGDSIGRIYRVKNLGFFQVFRPPYERFIERSLSIASKYYPEEKRDMITASRNIQAYEKMFWDSIYTG